ncbi:MAG TPA: beta-propeller fold lactonase family protein [Terracidiphilus sp.]|nr:beta-propeller fold lactonase family protein [Terracidiphilus sp.]
MTCRRQARLLAVALAAMAAIAVIAAAGGEPRGTAVRARLTGEHLVYASPVEMIFSRDGARLYVLCQGSDEIRVLDPRHNYAAIKTIAVGHIPREFSLSEDGARIFVANSWDDTISVIDARTLEVNATWKVGAEPSSVVEDPSGRFLFVPNRISDDIAVLDAKTGAEEKRLVAGRGASYVTPSPDGARAYVTHVYPIPNSGDTMGGDRGVPHTEITVVDTKTAMVVDRIRLNGVAHEFHIAFSRDGRLGVMASLHPKNLVPLAHLEHGGAFADTLTLFGADVGKPVEVPLDELERYASRPFGVAISPDKSRIFVSCEGSEAVLAIDGSKLLRFARTHPGSNAADLAASANYVLARIPVGHDPRGVVFTPDGGRVLVANRLDDTISVIETRTIRVVDTIHLATPDRISVLRHGEQTFYTSRYSFQGEIGCANCHIDSTFDGMTWDLEPDGFGRDIVDNRLIEDLRGTEPFKWNGGNPNLPTECGPRTEMYFWRSQNYDDLTLADLVTYIRNIPLRPNRWRSRDGQLTPAEERGKALFERATDKLGQPIPLENRCSYCHSGPKGTIQKSFDVGTKKATDNSGLLDTPQLTNIALTGPYLHDGSAKTLEEIWTVFNPNDKHGRTNDLTKDELNDLIEYLRTR